MLPELPWRLASLRRVFGSCNGIDLTDRPTLGGGPQKEGEGPILKVRG